MTPAWAQRREEMLSDCLVSPDVFILMVDRLTAVFSWIQHDTRHEQPPRGHPGS
jgi:hypothetical protein